MSSRKLLMILAGTVATGESWLRSTLMKEQAEEAAEEERRKERLAAAEFRAQIYGKPLDMNDL